MAVMSGVYIIVAVALFDTTMVSSNSESCNVLQSYVQNAAYYSTDVKAFYHSYEWYNSTFWGGYELLPWIKNIGPHCWNSYSRHKFPVLLDMHPTVSEINSTVQDLYACLMAQDGNCQENVTVQVLKCDGHILYKLWNLWLYSTYWNDVYICFDRIYEETCNDLVSPLPAEQVNGSTSLIQTNWKELELGWYESVFVGKNFTIPSLEDVNNVVDICYGEDSKGLYRQDTNTIVVGETPIGMRVCFVSDYEYDTYFGGNNYGNNLFYCDDHISIRSCNGKLQLDLSLVLHYEENVCLARVYNVKVIPEIKHNVEKIEEGGTEFNQYKPYLQYRCVFEMTESAMYEVKWNFNKVFLITKGPSNNPDELVLTEEDLRYPSLGYTVQCFVSVVSRKRGIIDPDEMVSEDFFAGVKVADSSIVLRRSDTKYTSVELTVPTGCTYNDAEPADCRDTLSLTDPGIDNDICSDGVFAVNANDQTSNVHNIQSLKVNENWTGAETYPFIVETIDKTYDDQKKYSLNVQLNGGTATTAQNGNIRVDVADWKYTKNKMCYSHVDPHMRTGNLRGYEQQHEGDYMLYKNIEHEVEVLERALPCYDNGNRPMCACGVIVRAGRDAFTINRCMRPFEIGFIQCGDCGILDVVKVSDSKYEIYTPIATKITVQLLDDWANKRSMNIDIYLMVKDFGRTRGLCGLFDDDNLNDFVMRDNTKVDNNDDYRFSNSWRLRYTENMFVNRNRTLYKWQSARPRCRRRDSITDAKCMLVNGSCDTKRKRRETDGKSLKMKTFNHQYIDVVNDRSKRNSETNITESEARQMCSEKILNTPAVLEMPDKLADEDPENVIEQCVYDVVIGNDASWADAHVIALDNIAIDIINLNPVFKSNNTELVETFLSHTCVNNCSKNGVCTNEGLCNCTGMYKGHDCGVDIRIPPVIFDIEYGGTCDEINENDCRCFTIRTDNIFEGFECDIKALKMNFNGDLEEIATSRLKGEYGDLYTGDCCMYSGLGDVSETETEPFVQAYEIAISNDGVHFGVAGTVYVYDPTCLYIDEAAEITIVTVQKGYCYIGDECVEHGSTKKGDTDNECLVCDSGKNVFSWTVESCNKKDKAALIGIIIGSICFAVILCVVLVYCVCFKSSKNRRAIAVNDENNTTVYQIDIENRTYPNYIMPAASKPISFKSSSKNRSFAANGTINLGCNAETQRNVDSDSTEIFPDLSVQGASTSVCRRNMLTADEQSFNGDAGVEINEKIAANSESFMSSDRMNSINQVLNYYDQTLDGPMERGVSAVSLKII